MPESEFQPESPESPESAESKVKRYTEVAASLQESRDLQEKAGQDISRHVNTLALLFEDLRSLKVVHDEKPAMAFVVGDQVVILRWDDKLHIEVFKAIKILS